MKKIKNVLFSFVLLAALAVSGCNSKPKDADIDTKVEAALNAHPETTGLAVDVKNGVATITGEVKDAAAQSMVTSTAQGVKGVKTVNNNTTIMAPVVITPDDPLLIGVRDATKDFPGATATVNDGVIMVSGELSAADWKTLKMRLDGLSPKKVDATALKIK